MASSSSSNYNSRWKYDVFLSFRGEDTRKNFTDHLYSALVRAGINTFRDDNELERGEEIGAELLKAIEESRFSIIVLSKNYASSTWCLDELEHILACRRTLGHTVWPIFYYVNPSDVRKQKGRLAEAFREHEERFEDDIHKVTRWRVALRKVANLKGLDLQNQADGHESKNIDNIVKEILDRLHRTKLSVAIHPVGLRYRAKKVISMLVDESLDVRIVGIYGIGGLGKTTIAKEVYNSISHIFEASCFLAKLRENSDPKGMIQLQRQLLSDTLMGKHEEIFNVDRGLKVIEERLCQRRVLIILDDVDELNQLNQILGDRSWLFPGSRVIITTTIIDLLKPSRFYQQYEVEELTKKESLQLLSLHAFDKAHPIEDYMECAQGVVRYAGGNPLVLEVLGSSLSGKHIDVWNSTLEKLKVISNKDIHTRLKISYNSLDDVQKSLFLDIACFFVGFDKDYVISTLYDFFPIEGINELMRRCLISIDFDNKLMIHDLLRDMGREIVRQESPVEPGNRSRLWHHADAIDVLTNKTGTKHIEGLILDLPGQCERLSAKAFKTMNRLRLLQVNYVCLTGSFEKFSRKLRWLCWHGFPLGSVPADLHLGNLVSLDMQYSKLNQFPGDVMNLPKLKFLDLSHSHLLTKVSNLEGFPNLEILSLEDCTILVELHDSIRFLTRLHSLNLQDCKSLWSGKMRSLNNPNIPGWSKLKKLPNKIENFENLERRLPLGELLLTASPRKDLCIIGIFPASLEKLNLSYCNLSDDMIPHDLGGLTLLKTLDLRGNNFHCLPASIGSLPKLRKLLLNECKTLHSLPELPSSLWDLRARECLSLESVNLVNFHRHHIFDLINCPKLKVAEGYQLEPIGVEIVEKLLRARGLFTPESIASVHMHKWNNARVTNCISPLQVLSFSLSLSLSVSLSLCVCVSVCNYISPLQVLSVCVCVCVCTSLSLSLFSFVILILLMEHALSDGGFYSIFLPLNEIPSWFSHQSEGNRISFQVPESPPGYKIIGFDICAVYASKIGSTSCYNNLNVTIETKKFGLRYFPAVHFVNEFHDVIWLSHWALDSMIEIIDPQKSWRFQDVMEEGDQVQVLINSRHKATVKRCAIRLLYEQSDQGFQSNNLATTSFVRPPVNVFRPTRRNKLYREDELTSMDDEAGGPTCMIERESAGAQREKHIFSRIWTIDAPSKMKHFLWRCFRGTVPVQEEHSKRGIRAEGCGFCVETETLDHLLLQCPFAQAIWLSSPLQLDLRVEAPGSFMLWLLDLSDRWKQDACMDDKWRLVAFTVWMIWKARNDLLYRAMKWEPISISYKIVENISEFIGASRKGSKINVNTMIDDDCQGHSRWMKSPLNLNVHASWIKERRCRNVGAIIRDHHGTFMEAMSKKFNHIPSAISIEAKAVLEALQFCADHSLKELIVHGDYKDVLEIFKFGKDDVQLAAYVEDVSTLVLPSNPTRLVGRDEELNTTDHSELIEKFWNVPLATSIYFEFTKNLI